MISSQKKSRRGRPRAIRRETSIWCSFSIKNFPVSARVLIKQAAADRRQTIADFVTAAVIKFVQKRK